MLKLVRGLVPILIVLMGATAMAESGPQGRWWQTPRIVKELNLTPNEVRQLETAWEHSRAKMIKLKSQVESEQFKLETLLEKRKLDEKAVREQNRKLEAARSRLAEERTAFVVEVRKIIGRDRFQRLADMR